MKKILAILMALVMCVSLSACGSSKEPEETVDEKVISAVKSDITAEIILFYDTVGVPSITCFVDEISENEFEVTGKVTVKDKYGDTYTGKYDAVVEYDPSTDECDVDCELYKLYKD